MKTRSAALIDGIGSALLFTLLVALPVLAAVATCAAVPVLAWKCAVSP